MSDIGKQVRELEKERRVYMQEVMKEYDKTHYANLKVLRDQCTHNFRFSHLGPVGHAWHYCSICGRSKVDALD